jgi:type II secretion system protein C
LNNPPGCTHHSFYDVHPIAGPPTQGTNVVKKIIPLSTITLLAILGIAIADKRYGRNFSGPNPSASPSELGVTPTSDTSVPRPAMKLVEVLPTSDPRRGHAIFQIDMSLPETFVPGEAVTSGWTLDSIYTDMAILKRGSRSIAVRLERQVPAPAVSITAGSTPLVQSTTAPESSGGPLTDIIEQQAIYSSGRIIGIKVTPGRNVDAFQSLGLQPGDIITSVNDHRVESLTNHSEILSFMEEDEVIHLTLIRNGYTYSFPTTLSSVPRTAR